MGVRLYTPGLGRFLSVDSILGGNANAYDYCTADPINCTDLDGRWGCWKSCDAAKKVGKTAWKYKYDIALTALSFTPGVGAGVWAYRGARAVRAVSCVANSFVAGTQVLMGDGSWRSIEDIEMGDQVMAADPVTGQTVSEPVEDTIVGVGLKELVALEIDADGDTRLGRLTATAGHPIFSVDRATYVDAGDLRSGEHLWSGTRGANPILRHATRFGLRTTVYNLTVTRLATYFVKVDAQPLLVHNCKRPPIRI